MLLLSGQTSEAWEHFKKQRSFGNRSNFDIKVLSPFVAFKRLKSTYSETADHDQLTAHKWDKTVALVC
jgi:hypothetical protein